MRFTPETITGGVSERPFTLGDVPGVLWSPAGDPGRHADVPMFEVESSLRFFGRHLGTSKTMAFRP
jgi:hypothetical protein